MIAAKTDIRGQQVIEVVPALHRQNEQHHLARDLHCNQRGSAEEVPARIVGFAGLHDL